MGADFLEQSLQFLLQPPPSASPDINIKSFSLCCETIKGKVQNISFLFPLFYCNASPTTQYKPNTIPLITFSLEHLSSAVQIIPQTIESIKLLVNLSSLTSERQRVRSIRLDAGSATQRGQTSAALPHVLLLFLLLEVRHQQKSVPARLPPTFICEATAILMKLDCVRPRHRKLSPDGRWTDMEFESAEMEKRESIRRRNTCPRAAFVFRLPSV